jgi:AcrR family transcriptional regulator
MLRAATLSKPSATSDRRDALREALIDAAERRIAASGLAALRARDVAADAGCALGAIYLVFDDLDALTTAVCARTLRALEASAAAIARPEAPARTRDDEIDRAIATLKRLAALYLKFARENRNLWRALFEHRPGEASAQEAPLALILGAIEQQIRILAPEATVHQRGLYGQALLAAVHGVIDFGLDEKRWGAKGTDLDWQVQAMVEAAARAQWR